MLEKDHPLKLDSCLFKDCRWSFKDAASRTVAFMKVLHDIPGCHVIEQTFKVKRTNEGG